MNYPLFLASRLRLSGTRGGSSTGVRIAVTGIALSMIAMIVAVSVMLGFKNEIRGKIMGFDAQLTVRAADAEKPVEQYGHAIKLIQPRLPQGVTLTPVARQPVVLKTDSAYAGLVMKGVRGNQKLISQSIIDGEMPTFQDTSSAQSIVVSKIVAKRLGLKAGDKVFAFFTDQNGIKTRRLLVAGIYDTHFSDYDQTMVIGSLDILQQLSHAPEATCASVEVNGLLSDDLIDQKDRELKDVLTQAYYDHKTGELLTVGNVHDSAALYFNWLALLDTNVVVLIILLSIVAAFTLVSSLFIIVLDKVKMIGLLKSMGATNRGISRVFIFLGQRIVLMGLLVGDSVALAVLYCQKWFGLMPLDADSYYLDLVPVEVSWWWILWLNGGAIILAFLVLLLPTRIVSSISPAKVMRYE